MKKKWQQKNLLMCPKLLDHYTVSAKLLRKNMTEAEKKLWQRLRGEQCGVKFRRQHPFEHFILDFVCLEKKLVIEVDGAQHAENIQYDGYRTFQLQQAGFTVLRFWNNQVLEETDTVLDSIWNCLQAFESGNPSPPQPSP